MAITRPVTLSDERGRFGEFGGKVVPETLMPPWPSQPASSGWTPWEVILEEFRPIRI